ncbi:cardiomyopathy-associated protein 5-like isoform X2 [Entelurus aequoreus]|uniref:cardiomyopathy-associated protein 5-like isoform X2 n=1 Tax=Entelurus aequoreus TaxID=161455 RepID=UPI002B1D5B6F|nr:cardiomyopathy-associated protein 5-like isoform X2 [Entelurus aequoreus]
MCERTIAEYEEELSPTKEEKERQHQVVLHTTDVQQPLHIKEEEEDPQPTHIKEEEDDPQPTHIKEEDDDLQPTHIKEEEDDPQPTYIKEEEEDPQPTYIKEEDDDPQPTYIKEEEEDPHMKEEEEDDVSKFPLTVVSVKTEEHEDKAPESSQLHHSPNVQRVSAGSHEEEWHTSVGQKELQAPSHIKEEQLHDEDEAQSLQLHHSQSEENRGAELVSPSVGAR